MQEVDAIESEVRQMQSDLAEVEELLSSPHTLPKHKEEKLKVAPSSQGTHFTASSWQEVVKFLNEAASLLCSSPTPSLLLLCSSSTPPLLLPCPSRF